MQTGIPYPNAKGHKYEPSNIDGSVIEFCGHELDFDASNYDFLLTKQGNCQQESCFAGQDFPYRKM